MTLDHLARWLEGGSHAALATVVGVRGSAPRRESSKLAVTESGEMEGSVSGGCVENDVILHAQEALSTGSPRLVTYGIADEDAFAIGLTCGGTIQVFIDPHPGDGLAARQTLVEARTPGAVVTLLSGDRAGDKVVVDLDAASVVYGRLPDGHQTAIVEDAASLLAGESSRSLRYGDVDVFIEPLVAAPHLIVVGAGHVAQQLVQIAKMLSFEVTVIDARAAFATRERFPNADDVVVSWPDRVLDELTLDDRTYVALLSHDERFEDPILPLILRSDVRYVGAMGSRKTHAARVERLRKAGLDQEHISRLHAPIGLDIGAVTPGEIAVGIAAEITAARYAPRRTADLIGEPVPVTD